MIRELKRSPEDALVGSKLMRRQGTASGQPALRYRKINAGTNSLGSYHLTAQAML